MSQTIFERYGGFGTISQVVTRFYDKVLESEVVAPYFENVDMERLIDHQTKFVATVTGGPADYPPEVLGQIHRKFVISENAFSEVIHLLRLTLEEFSVHSVDVETICEEFTKRKNSIVSAP